MTEVAGHSHLDRSCGGRLLPGPPVQPLAPRLEVDYPAPSRNWRLEDLDPDLVVVVHGRPETALLERENGKNDHLGR
jgi:hypothetical protein